MIAFLVIFATLAGRPQAGDSNVHPPVTRDDVKILQRAEQVLDSPAKWNRNDNRQCPADAKTFSLYCAIERATDEVTGHFAHREAAMQEVRFVIDSIAAHRNYEHRLMNYNNDSTTTFADIQHVLRTAETNIEKKLEQQAPAGPNAPRR